MNRLIFLLLSIAYIAAIFLFANSPMVSTISLLNPYSLLHLPLYGILAFLLYFSLRAPGHSMLLLPGLIALGVGIADEIHQAFVPGREASVGDVFLDLAGIIIALWIIRKVYCRKPV